jgi:hypothetical protein
MKTVSHIQLLKLVTGIVSIILIYSMIGITNGAQPNNIIDKFDTSRDTTYLSIIPASQNVDYFETFSIIVHLDPGEPIIGVQIDLSFDPDLIQVDSVVSADPIWFFLPPIINNTAGEIHGAGVAVFGINITWPIDCFQMTFTAQNIDGISPMVLHNVIITNQTAEPITDWVINNGQVIVGTPGNQPPMFGGPSPVNGSTGNPLSLTWSIPINDPEGNSFSWSIQCSNGLTNSGTGASNGTKTLVLSGLAYSTIYKVWVNATDPAPGSGVYTRRWYQFTTLAQNFPPVFGSPSPGNGSTGNPLSLTWSIPMNDPEGNHFSWSIQCSNGQANSGSGASNGTKSLSLSGLAYSTTYTVWVNATDPSGSGLYTRAWFTFSTLINFPPIFGSPSPANGSINNPLSFSWSIPINDPEGNSFSWTIQCSNGQTNSGSGASNGTKSLSLSSLQYATMYTVWVNATDPAPGSGSYTRRWYTFTTLVQNLPPVFGSPSPADASTGNPLSLTWSIPINDPNGDLFSWTIQCNNGQTNSGTGASNGTKSLALSGLEYSTTYTVWVNATDPAPGSGSYTRRWYIFTTKLPNNPPVFGSPSPANGSINNPLSFTWGIQINDLEGDSLSWWIQCSNGQSNSGSSATNGTKTLLISGLVYSTMYTVWVNATDPGGSGLYTRAWFTFTTQQQQNSAPNKPNTPTGPASGKPGTVYTYSTSTTDPNTDQVYYQWDWGDGTTTSWLGPYASGATINTTHSWAKGSYSIKVKAKDPYGAESPWSDPLTVTMPKSIPINSLLQILKHFFQQFPHVFPFLRYILGL